MSYAKMLAKLVNSKPHDVIVSGRLCTLLAQ